MASGSIDNVKWTQVELKIFTEFMIDNVKRGNKTASMFKKTGWNDIKARMENYLGRVISKEQLRNKIYKQRTEYSNFKKLLDTTGFGWNSTTRTATVDDELAWDRAIQANPTWSKFKKNGLSYWPELCIIFGDSYA
ncbi:L10-interacting MYB domain-containing protein-like [Telopea speciosissima]|uniref:L10-interacting MYB domain-containing protein-like n=1 Tax=Telopea speciosissima TaxID=54955 RepID=UPI001CC81D82|nr:L10-interacting MYB domain-containing protein-like [Telopea speciosissima]